MPRKNYRQYKRASRRVALMRKKQRSIAAGKAQAFKQSRYSVRALLRRPSLRFIRRSAPANVRRGYKTRKARPMRSKRTYNLNRRPRRLGGDVHTSSITYLCPPAILQNCCSDTVVTQAIAPYDANQPAAGVVSAMVVSHPFKGADCRVANIYGSGQNQQIPYDVRFQDNAYPLYGLFFRATFDLRSHVLTGTFIEQMRQFLMYKLHKCTYVFKRQSTGTAAKLMVPYTLNVCYPQHGSEIFHAMDLKKYMSRRILLRPGRRVRVSFYPRPFRAALQTSSFTLGQQLGTTAPIVGRATGMANMRKESQSSYAKNQWVRCTDFNDWYERFRQGPEAANNTAASALIAQHYFPDIPGPYIYMTTPYSQPPTDAQGNSTPQTQCFPITAARAAMINPNPPQQFVYYPLQCPRQDAQGSICDFSDVICSRYSKVLFRHRIRAMPAAGDIAAFCYPSYRPFISEENGRVATLTTRFQNYAPPTEEVPANLGNPGTWTGSANIRFSTVTALDEVNSAPSVDFGHAPNSTAADPAPCVTDATFNSATFQQNYDTYVCRADISSGNVAIYQEIPNARPREPDTAAPVPQSITTMPITDVNAPGGSAV